MCSALVRNKDNGHMSIRRVKLLLLFPIEEETIVVQDVAQ